MTANRRLSRRQFLRIATLAAVGAVTSSCIDPQNINSCPPVSGGDSPEPSSFYCDFTVFAGEYTPNSARTWGMVETVPREALAQIAVSWVDLYPTAKVRFVEQPPLMPLESWITTQAFLDTGPDILTVPLPYLNGLSVLGAVVPINEYLKMPNPFAPDAAPTWGASFNGSVLGTAGTPGKLGGVPLDRTVTGVYLNLDMLARAGIDPAEVEATGTGALPDWQALIEWCQKLQALDVLPFSMAYSILDGWLMGILADQFFWPYTEQLDLFNYHDPETSPDQAGTVSQEEIVYQVLVNGWRPFSEAPMRGYFELLKAFKPYLPIGAETRSIMRYSWDKFMNQQLAMLWEGCWLVRDLAADDLLPFEWGGMWLPPVTRASSPFAPDPAMLPVDVGGYSSAAGINIAAVERGHLQQCIDWLMLTTTPENNSHLVNEVPMLLPSVRGAAIPPEMGKLLGDRLDAPPGVHAWQPPIYWLGSGGHTTFYDVIQREMGLWLLGERSLEQFLATADSELALQSREVLAANAVQYHADGSWDLTRWPKQPPPPSF